GAAHIAVGDGDAGGAIVAGMYFFNTEEIRGAFESLNYPTYLIYPLGIAKLLGLVAILTRKSDTLKEWAYAGFFFDFLLAGAAHIAVGDGDAGGAIVATVLLLTSYFMQKSVFSK
ncbi:MAG: DoxX family protein, partial [Bacteroidota bacterium]